MTLLAPESTVATVSIESTLSLIRGVVLELSRNGQSHWVVSSSDELDSSCVICISGNLFTTSCLILLCLRGTLPLWTVNLVLSLGLDWRLFWIITGTDLITELLTKLVRAVRRALAFALLITLQYLAWLLDGFAKTVGRGMVVVRFLPVGTTSTDWNFPYPPLFCLHPCRLTISCTPEYSVVLVVAVVWVVLQL